MVSAAAGKGYVSFARRITSYDEASRTATLESLLGTDDPEDGLQLEPLDNYFVFGALVALDAPGEWFLDEAAGQLYFHAPGGADPQHSRD